MKDNLFLLLVMIFLHIIDDYKLQAGVLNCLKQRKWWEDQPEYNNLYKYDYIIGLVMHSFSWTFMITLPIMYLLSFKIGFAFILLFIWNMIIHAVVDHLKANVGIINLIVDQTCHIMQIVTTWIIYIYGNINW